MFRSLVLRSVRAQLQLQSRWHAPTRSYAAAVTVDAIKALRSATGAGISDCKKALEQENGDMEKAKEWLRKKGILKSAQRQDRLASQGFIGVAALGSTRCALVEVNSETDFVARNNLFQALVTAISRAALQLPPISAAPALLLQAPISVQGTTLSVGEHLAAAGSVVGEKLDLRRVRVLEAPADGVVAYYVHGTPDGLEPVVADGVVSSMGQLGVAMSVFADPKDAVTMASTARKLCMHVAAASPLFISKEHITAEARAREEEIARAQAAEAGKSGKQAEMLIAGRLGKWEKEVVLYEQVFMLDASGKSTVRQFLTQSCPTLKVLEMARLRLGGN